MSLTKTEAYELMKKWGVKSRKIAKFVFAQNPEDRYELCGWIQKMAPNVNLEDLETYHNGWKSTLYKPQIEAETKRISEQIQPPQVEEGIYTCRKCKSERTVSVSRQIRSMDEPMTVFIKCINCGKRWKE